MAGTRKDDLWGCIDFHQEDAETPNAELLASLPPVAPSKPPQDTSAIYAFLGCATLQRLRKCNPRLHDLPRELVTRIARYAHRPEYRCCWLGTENSVQKNSEASSVDVTDFHHGLQRSLASCAGAIDSRGVGEPDDRRRAHPGGFPGRGARDGLPGRCRTRGLLVAPTPSTRH